MEIIKNIKKLIVKNLNLAIQELSKYLDSNSTHYNEFILLQTRIRRVEIGLRQGQIDWHVADLEKTKLTKSTIDLLDDLTETDLILLNQINMVSLSENNDEIEDLEDNLGYLDYTELSKESGDIIRLSMTNMSNYINEIGTKMRTATTKLETLSTKNLNQTEKIKEVKIVSNNLAKEIEEFDRKLDFELRDFKENSPQWIDSQYKAIKKSYASGVDDEDDLKFLLTALIRFKGSLSFASSSMRNFYTVINSLPKVTLKFNIARNKASNTILKLVKELDLLLNKTDEFGDNILKTIEEKKNYE